MGRETKTAACVCLAMGCVANFFASALAFTNGGGAFCCSHWPFPVRVSLGHATCSTTGACSVLRRGERGVQRCAQRRASPALVLLKAKKKNGGDSRKEDVELLAAIEDGDVAQVERALAAGGSASAVDAWGTSYLQLAVKAGHRGVTHALLEAGADPDCASVSDEETSPLHCAARFGRCDIAALLLAAGATATKRDEWGDRPLDIAKRSNDKGLIELLKTASSVGGVELEHDTGGKDTSSLEKARYLEGSYADGDGQKNKNMGAAESRELVDAAADWDSAELGRECEEGSLVEMLLDPDTGEQYLRRVPLKKGARSLFKEQEQEQGEARA